MGSSCTSRRSRKMQMKARTHSTAQTREWVTLHQEVGPLQVSPRLRRTDTPHGAGRVRTSASAPGEPWGRVDESQPGGSPPAAASVPGVQLRPPQARVQLRQRSAPRGFTPTTQPVAHMPWGRPAAVRFYKARRRARMRAE